MMHNGDREPKEGWRLHRLIFFRGWAGGGGIHCIPLMASSLLDTLRNDKQSRGYLKSETHFMAVPHGFS